MHQLYTFVVLLYYFGDGLWFACAFVRRVMSSIDHGSIFPKDI